jgi:hypothetical protein
MRPIRHIIYTGNLESVPTLYNLQFINDRGLTGDGSVLNNFAYFKVFLPVPLWNIWVAGGSMGHYNVFDASEHSITFDGTNYVQLEGLLLPAASKYQIRIDGYLNSGIDVTHMPDETINFRQILDDGSGTITGNFSFLVTYKETPIPPGVLAVTEISQGPAVHRGHEAGVTGGCEYAELIAGNCGSDASQFVDVSGWIIDDNNGIFNTTGCTPDGVTPGHYRLSPTSDVWKCVSAGSVIIVYNADNNCYNLPDLFTVDYNTSTYWVPCAV